MHPLARLRSVEEKRDHLLARVEALDPEVVTAPPAPGKWCIAEIVEHLVLAEESVMGDPATLDQRRPRRRTIRGRILYWVVMGILRFDIAVDVPDPAMLPRGERSLPELRRRWEASHAGLRRWLEEGSPSEGEGAAYFKHPVVGGMTASQSLFMLEVHLDRHMRQIEAIVGSGETNVDGRGWSEKT